MFNKLKNNTFYKSTFILLFGGIFGKIVGFLLKIIITRKLGGQTIGIYSLLSPYSSFLTVLAIFSYSNSISNIMSKNRVKINDLFYSIFTISLIINAIIIFIVLLSAKFFSNDLLHNKELFLPIICISLTMPSMSISAIIKGYFWSKQQMSPYMLSNFIEQVVRLVLVILFIDKFISIGNIASICFIILINIIGELSSQITMLLFIPKDDLKIKNTKFNKNYVKEVMSFSIPVTFSKLIGSISYFLEPILLTNILLYLGYTNSFISFEYGSINAYALSTLLMPQFFTQNMATSLIPELSKQYNLNNIKLCIRRIKEIIILSCLIGGLSTLIITLFPKLILNLLYNTTEGIDYIYLLSPFTILFYIEYPLNNALQALGKSKDIFKITIKTSIVRILSIIIFSFLRIGMYSLVISIIINLILSTLLYYKEIKKVLTIT